MSDNYDEKYTDPELRRRLKEEIQQSDKGGKPGQWSARKSQLLVQEYERQGGGYVTPVKDEAARSLECWTEEDWQTKEGSARAREGDTTHRYLPTEAWDQLTEEEKEETDRRKRQGSREGRQYIANPPAAAQAGRGAVLHAHGHTPTKEELYERAQELDIDGRSKMSKAELQAAIHRVEASSLDRMTKERLYDMAQERNIPGRSKMSKEKLAQAIRAADR